MTAPPQPYNDRDATFEAFGYHVNAGKVAMYRRLGLDAMMGTRKGATFNDAWVDEGFINCHCNGGVLNFGHRHPRIVAALRNTLDEWTARVTATPVVDVRPMWARHYWKVRNRRADI